MKRREFLKQGAAVGAAAAMPGLASAQSVPTLEVLLANALVSGSLDKAAFADADFVIEAVFEDLAVKQQVFAELEEHVSAECVLATNTSSLSITEMASKLAHPERVVGFHFFNPVAIMPLLEIVRADQTDDATLATAFATGKQLKKSSVGWNVFTSMPVSPAASAAACTSFVI